MTKPLMSWRAPIRIGYADVSPLSPCWKSMINALARQDVDGALRAQTPLHELSHTHFTTTMSYVLDASNETPTFSSKPRTQ
jgi:hypothetical protein